MKEGEAKPKTTASSLLNKTEKMDRRDFLVAAGKLVIPTLGMLGLSLSLGGKAQAACNNCQDTCRNVGCSGDCFSACSGTCSGSCSGTCSGGCGNVAN
jgi:CXXX repeat radical SAM target protein